MAFNWNDHPIEDPKDAAAFDWNDHPIEGKGVSQLESGLRGAAQGATFGFADELTGGLEAAKDWITNDPAGFMDNYKKHRDEARVNYRAAEAANPKTYLGGQLGGSVPTLFVPGLGAAEAGAGLASVIGRGAVQGAAMGLGASEGENASDLARDAAIGAGVGGAAGAIGDKIVGPAISGASNLAESFGNRLTGTADRLFEKATGATGKQSEKFAEGAGRELRNRNLIRFGDSPEKIAERVGAAHAESGQAIGQALEALDAKGVTASLSNVADAIESRIKDLSETPGNEKIIKQLNAELDNLYERGQSEIPISKGEVAKRNYQSQTNYNSPEAEKKATAQVANALRQEVEGSALKADPALAEKFTEGKNTWSLLKPIKEAAEKRAAQLNQSPWGGLLDTSAGLYGLSDPDSFSGKAALAVAGRRLISPRLASSAAVLTDNLAQVVSKAPQLLGKFARPLQAAAVRGGSSLGATHFVLMQTNPEYRKLMLESGEDKEE